MAEKEFNEETLSSCNGKEGRPVYISHKGQVIDVTESPLWKTGTHMQMHPAGRDLTTEIKSAPHGLEVLERYPRIGTLVKSEGNERELPPFLARFLKRYPFFRRHPHPATVHFPIVFMLSAPFFSLLCLLTGNQSFDATSFYCLAAGLIFTPPAMLTGFLTWWLNYMARPMRPVTIKLWLSFILLVMALILFVWKLAQPLVLSDLQGPGLLYVLLLSALAPVVLIIGYFGGTLTFPVEGE
jgi:predicted heme/steroid binding protein/uncharacterized membrane protein